MPYRPAVAGFTLIEVLVAVAIVAVTLGAGVRAASALADNAGRLSEVVAAQWCADNHLVNMKLSRQFPGLGESEFTCNQLGLEFKGLVVVRGTYNPNFRRVDAQMLNANGHPVVNLSTVLPRY